MSAGDARKFKAAFAEAVSMRKKRVGRPSQRGRDLRVYWAVQTAVRRGYPLSPPAVGENRRASTVSNAANIRCKAGAPFGKRSAFELVAEQMCREAKCLDRRHWYATPAKIRVIYYRALLRSKRARDMWIGC